MSIQTEDLRDRVAKKLAANPAIKTGMLADALGVPESEVLRAMPDGYASELNGRDIEELIKGIERLGVIYFVTRNGACVTEIKGIFGGFSKSGPFLNVSGEGIHLHLRTDKIATVFHVTPPASDDRPTWPSLQFFQSDGNVAFKVFLMEQLQRESGCDFATSLVELERLVKGT